jgi:hypothetical protein
MHLAGALLHLERGKGREALPIATPCKNHSEGYGAASHANLDNRKNR